MSITWAVPDASPERWELLASAVAVSVVMSLVWWLGERVVRGFVAWLARGGDEA